MIQAPVIEPRREASWDDVTLGAEGELFLSRQWLGALEEVFDLHFEGVVSHDRSGRLRGALPFCSIDDARGSRISIAPFCDFVAPVLGPGTTWDELITPVLDRGRPVTFTTVADSPVAGDPRFVCDGQAVRQVVPLDLDVDGLVARFSSHHKRHLGKARRAGITFRPAKCRQELRSFYELHLGVRKHKYRMLAQPYRLFETLWERFVEPGDGALMLGFDGPVVAGGCLVLRAGDTLYYKYAASHPAYRAVGVSHGAVAATIEWAVEEGLAQLDLGRSDVDQPGLIDFKRRFGAHSIDLHRYRARDRDEPTSAELDDVLGRVTSLLTGPEVPDSMTEEAGNWLYRLFA